MAAPSGSATLAYQNRVTSNVTQMLFPRLAIHFDQLRQAGSIKIIYRVRADGGVEGVKVFSGRASRIIVETCVRTIKGLKLPPIPKDVIGEQGHSWVEVESEIAINQ